MHSAPGRLRPALIGIGAALATAGVLAAFGGRVEASPGRVAFVLAPAWAGPEVPDVPEPLPQARGGGGGGGADPSRERAVAAVARVHADVAARIEDLDRRLAERDAAQQRRIDAAMARLEAALSALRDR